MNENSMHEESIENITLTEADRDQLLSQIEKLTDELNERNEEIEMLKEMAQDRQDCIDEIYRLCRQF